MGQSVSDVDSSLLSLSLSLPSQSAINLSEVGENKTTIDHFVAQNRFKIL